VREVEVEDVWKTYGQGWVLQSINLTVERGEFLAVMGPNGSGKSTLAKILATVEVPTRGRVSIRGCDTISDSKGAREWLSYLPEEHALSKYLTGMENILFFGRLYGLGKGEIVARARELLEEFGLREHAGKQVGRYSKGMRQKLSTIIALLPQKPIMILDEPAAGLDPLARRELLSLLLKRVEGSTILMNTHVGEDAEIAGRVVFLSRGRIVAAGRPDELRQRFVKGEVLHVKLPVKSDKLEGLLKSISTGSLLRVTGEGYRVYVGDADEAAKEISEKSRELGLKVSIVREEPSLEDAYVFAVGGYD